MLGTDFSGMRHDGLQVYLDPHSWWCDYGAKSLDKSLEETPKGEVGGGTVPAFVFVSFLFFPLIILSSFLPSTKAGIWTQEG